MGWPALSTIALPISVDRSAVVSRVGRRVAAMKASSKGAQVVTQRTGPPGDEDLCSHDNAASGVQITVARGNSRLDHEVHQLRRRSSSPYAMTLIRAVP